MDGNGNLRTVAWDDALHTYPVQETIEVGGGNPDLAISVDYNIGLGVVTLSTDFNGHQTHYNYDRFGRLTSIIKPGDSSQFPTQSFSYTMADPAQSLLYSYDNEGNLTLQTGIVSPSSVSTSIREISRTGRDLRRHPVRGRPGPQARPGGRGRDRLYCQGGGAVQRQG